MQCHLSRRMAFQQVRMGHPRCMDFGPMLGPKLSGFKDHVALERFGPGLLQAMRTSCLVLYLLCLPQCLPRVCSTEASHSLRKHHRGPLDILRLSEQRKHLSLCFDLLCLCSKGLCGHWRRCGFNCCRKLAHLCFRSLFGACGTQPRV